MKNLLASIICAVLTICSAAAQTNLKGTISDGKEPLTGVNVFILGTLEGGITDTLGHYEFSTTLKGEVTICASLLGFEEYRKTADISLLTNLQIELHENSATLDEVVVTASTYSIGKSNQIKTLDALDVVMSGNSCGDLVAAVQSLPGTQKVGEDGKLYVRGGDSEECQTFINGMHVLVPYGTNTENNAVRGRFSPFLFKGMSFSLGGYGGEYGQALSSVLPMETTDVATSDKLGVSASLLDWNIGGTKSFRSSSLSFNADYTDLKMYNAMFPDRYDWKRPYHKLSGEAQFKSELSNSVEFKSYAGYDYTSLAQRIDGRELSLNEHNVYANATVKADLGNDWSLFAGVANSSVFNDVEDALVKGDHYRNNRNEIHLKAEVKKRISPIIKLSAGIEDYLRTSTMQYDDYKYDLDYNLLATHLDAQWRIVPKLFLNASARAEHLNYAGEWLLMPRMTLSYVPGGNFQASVMVGRYSQTASDDNIVKSDKALGQSTADHAIISMQWASVHTLFRLEPYYKKYRRLPLINGGFCTAEGYGRSRGFDMFFENDSMIENLKVNAAYSFNDSRRLYQDFTVMRAPDYASRHNFRLSLKYSVKKIILGLSDSYASGRETAGGKAPFYNSLDGNLTWLASPKVIVYTSLSNILGRNNTFKYNADGSAVTESRKRFFYIGIFISIKNNKAYDISNF